MEKRRLRIDMKVDVRVIDEEKHLISMRMVPDPERYEKRTINGKKGYYDKYDNIFISLEVFAKGAETLAGAPLYAPAPSIRDLKQYFAEASERVTKSLESEVEWKPEKDRGAAFLEQNVGSKLLFVVLYIDMVDSTQLSRVLSDIAYRSLLSSFMREMTLIVDAHGGYVHKYTGDGLIGFFPAEHNYSGMTDSAVDCGLVMGLLMAQVLNPILNKRAYPSVEFRIGIDSGETQIVGFGAENVRATAELLSYTMNIAAKICAACPPNRILIGESVYRTLHVSRKNYFKAEVVSPERWNYLDAATNRVYPLYGLTASGR